MEYTKQQEMDFKKNLEKYVEKKSAHSQGPLLIGIILGIFSLAFIAIFGIFGIPIALIFILSIFGIRAMGTNSIKKQGRMLSRSVLELVAQPAMDAVFGGGKAFAALDTVTGQNWALWMQEYQRTMKLVPAMCTTDFSLAFATADGMAAFGSYLYGDGRTVARECGIGMIIKRPLIPTESSRLYSMVYDSAKEGYSVERADAGEITLSTEQEAYLQELISGLKELHADRVEVCILPDKTVLRCSETTGFFHLTVCRTGEGEQGLTEESGYMEQDLGVIKRFLDKI